MRIRLKKDVNRSPSLSTQRTQKEKHRNGSHEVRGINSSTARYFSSEQEQNSIKFTLNNTNSTVSRKVVPKNSTST